jgi:NAD(P)-dependent dehydrogenase (short-subunit alcohol dehydrogenase family)
MAHIAGKTVLITGAARRIGKALALDLAARGWSIGVHYRKSATEADALVSTIVAAGRKATALAADLADINDVVGLMSRCVARLGPVDCLINNASEFEFDTAATMTPADWARHMDCNLRAPVFLAREFAAQLPPGCTGLVINIIDQRVLRPSPEYFSYSLSKAALWDATRMLAQALAPRVRVNAIGPGPVLANIHQTPADFAAECASTLLGRGTSPEEIAAAVRFILDAPAMTGQMIVLDGGQHLTEAGSAPVSGLVGQPDR